MTTDLDATFTALRSILVAFAKRLVVVRDEPDHPYLDTKSDLANKWALFFGAVQKRKNAVSYYLMPLYTHSALVGSISPELKKHMTGKSCFTFRKHVEASLLKELDYLTKAGFKQYEADGYI